MPNCKYCGQPAGFFHWQHAECNQKHENGKCQLATAITAAASGDSALDSLDAQLGEIAARSYISKDEERSLVIQAWTAAVDHSLDHGFLEQSQEEHLIGIKDRLALSQSEADSGGGLSRVVKAGVLREVMRRGAPPCDSQWRAAHQSAKGREGSVGFPALRLPRR